MIAPKDDPKHAGLYEMKAEFDEAGVKSGTLDFQIAALEFGHALREGFSLGNFLKPKENLRQEEEAGDE